MKKSKQIGAQIYGYSVCLVAVITFLISIIMLVNAVTDLDDPLHAGWATPGSPSLASFENYKLDVLKSFQKGDDTNKSNYAPDDQTLHVMYEAAKADKIQSVRHRANGNIIIGGLLVTICAILFVTHWRWLRKLNKV